METLLGNPYWNCWNHNGNIRTTIPISQLVENFSSDQRQYGELTEKGMKGWTVSSMTGVIFLECIHSFLNSLVGEYVTFFFVNVI